MIHWKYLRLVRLDEFLKMGKFIGTIYDLVDHYEFKQEEIVRFVKCGVRVSYLIGHQKMSYYEYLSLIMEDRCHGSPHLECMFNHIQKSVRVDRPRW